MGIDLELIAHQEGNILLNDALNTLKKFMVMWCWTYGKGPLK